MRFFSKQRGQALVESIVLLLPVTFMFYFLFQYTISRWSYFYFSHEAYQSLICVAQGERPKRCEKDLRKHVQNWIPWAQIKNIKMDGFQNNWNVEVSWQDFFVKNQVFHLRRSLKIPEDIL